MHSRECHEDMSTEEGEDLEGRKSAWCIGGVRLSAWPGSVHYRIIRQERTPERVVKPEDETGTGAARHEAQTYVRVSVGW